MYWRALGGFSDVEFNDAVTEAILTISWYPTANELADLCKASRERTRRDRGYQLDFERVPGTLPPQDPNVEAEVLQGLSVTEYLGSKRAPDGRVPFREVLRLGWALNGKNPDEVEERLSERAEVTGWRPLITLDSHSSISIDTT